MINGERSTLLSPTDSRGDRRCPLRSAQRGSVETQSRPQLQRELACCFARLLRAHSREAVLEDGRVAAAVRRNAKQLQLVEVAQDRVGDTRLDQPPREALRIRDLCKQEHVAPIIQDRQRLALQRCVHYDVS
jgi:hypothetical protein